MCDLGRETSWIPREFTGNGCGVGVGTVVWMTSRMLLWPISLHTVDSEAVPERPINVLMVMVILW